MVKNVLTLFLCLSFLNLPLGCQRSEKQILVKIGNQTITVDDFKREVDRVRSEYLQYNITDKKLLNKLKTSSLERLIEEKIVLLEIDRLGIKITRDELDSEISRIKRDYPGESFTEMLISEYVSYRDWEERMRLKLLIEKLINQVIMPKVRIEDQEVERYFETHSQEFFVPEQIRASQIVVNTKAEAYEILKRLKAGEDFGKLAKEQSLSPDSENGGDLGFFERGHMPPEFDEVVFSLPIGKLSDIVKSPYGFHIFRVEDKRKARKMFLYEVYDQIEQRLMREKTEAEYDRWLRNIKNTAKVEVNHRLFEKINQ
ncbi:MAG: peptidylprolyl isomerase [Pseudomonadota bacterium]